MAVTGTMLTEATTVAIGTAVITTVATTAADTIRTTRPSLAVSRFQYLSLFRFLNKRSGSWLLAPGSSKKMPHFGAFGLEIPRVVRIGLRLDRKLFDNVHAIPFKPDHLFGVVGQETDVANAEIN